MLTMMARGWVKISDRPSAAKIVQLRVGVQIGSPPLTLATLPPEDRVVAYTAIP